MQSHFITNAASLHHISPAVFDQSVSGRLKTKLSLCVMHLMMLVEFSFEDGLTFASVGKNNFTYE